MGMEEYAIILDFLPTGHPEDKRPIYKREPIAIGIGESFFSLLELIPKKGVTLTSQERVYLGKEERDKIDFIKRRIPYDVLTPAAKTELDAAIEKIIEGNEKKFVDFFNESGPISVRFHQLELLPGIGNKLMWEVLEERKKKPFESFDDISKRIKTIPHPKDLIVKRIELELSGERQVGKGKYKIFTTPVKHERHHGY
jgi:putative nucleotide binding protein